MDGEEFMILIDLLQNLLTLKVGMGTGFNGVGLSSNPVVIRKQQINENY